MKKTKLIKVLCAIAILAESAFMALLLTKLYIFLYPGQSWQAVIGFVILLDFALCNALMIFRNK